MRIAVLILFCVFAPVGFSQIQITATGKVAAKPTPTPNSAFANAESLTTDFQNFKYVEAGSKTGASFQLVNGRFTGTDAKTKLVRSYQFRKKFFFDITGDNKTEAIVHMLADGCEFCQERSVFYAFSAVDNSPRIVFGIATGAGSKCGLKEIRFAPNEVYIEVFGDCNLVSGHLVPDATSKNTEVFTRYILSLDATDPKPFVYSTSPKELFPFPSSEIPAFRPQIKFGKQE